jgi:asparagine synthase (glutamine-hydrolysing)
MCGITGIIDLERLPVPAAELLAMTQAIAHRGPDDEGYVLIDQSGAACATFAGSGSPAEIRTQLPRFSATSSVPGANIALGHRRFSIIDLSASGHQPFFDREKMVCVVFNGEIYNYLELREELIARGAAFYTQSDTEVLLEAYKHWSTGCFSRFNGFWAIALYDFKKKLLLLSRDRIGKKPLYWTKLGSRVYFASEIKALLRIQEIHARRKVNEESVFYWLACGLKDLNFTTCFEGIHTLLSGCWTIVDRGFPDHPQTFWRVPIERLSERDISPEEAADTLRDTLADAVRIRLRSDVPLSIELSGGMDSSTLVALAARYRPNEISTYTVRFPETKRNEEPFAHSVALRYNTDQQVLDPPMEGFWSRILSFTYLEEEPYHSPNLQTNQVIWEQMRSRGTKVSLNGAAGDENFAGYPGYCLLAQTENLLHCRFYKYVKNSILYSQRRTGLKTLLQPLGKLTRELLQRLRAATVAGSGRSNLPPYFRGPAYSKFREPLTLSEALYRDMTNDLMPYWLRSGDRGYMGVPLEVRCPFLDYRVVELAFRLPITYLFRDGWHKWILRKAVEDLLPQDVVWRRRKMGFPFPRARFFAQHNQIIQTIIQESDNPYIDPAQSQAYADDWKVLSFVLWYELFFNENVALFRKIEAMSKQDVSLQNCGYFPAFLDSFQMERI